MTHEEACKSEKEGTEQVKADFPKCYEKEVLSQVHHSMVLLLHGLVV